ncbi:MAG: 2,3-diphosphoglycerate synthetase [Actinomycetota bacterium]|nr:2,3-diphosphoglycerate synthetase [Actinomycetota bacterium]
MAVIDGEHYPPVTESALDDLERRGHEILAAVLVGGKEKLPADGLKMLGSLPVNSGGDPREVLDRALWEHHPEAVIDLSDEPVLDYRRRHELAALALYRGVAYQGPDFLFRPPPRPRVATKPSLAIVGTGKRTGKTAVAGFAARALQEMGRSPVIVAMGRGGPPQPVVLRGDQVSLTPQDLMELADSGAHAASDYVEDALLGRAPTVGCRRCGGGLAGGVEISNVPEGVRKANELPGDLLLLEGSGSAVPPVHADATALVVPASIPREYVGGYFGPYRLLLADFVFVTMVEHPFASPTRVEELSSLLRSAFRPESNSDHKRDREGELQIVRTVFRPTPTRTVAGADAYVATTAPEVVAPALKRHLEERHGCRVVGISHALSDRERLRADLSEASGRMQVLLCEIKAAGIDVATRWALSEGVEVVYMDNVPEGVDGDDPTELIRSAAALADDRYKEGK